MKRQDKTELMIGQVLEPVAQDTSYARYRLDQLVASEVGKRTFFATALSSHADSPVGSPAESQVIVKLLLFGPDLPAEEYLQPVSVSAFDLPVSLPYLESFEVETLLGAGLVLVKPYVDMHRSGAYHSGAHHSELKTGGAAVSGEASVAAFSREPAVNRASSSHGFTNRYSDRIALSSQNISLPSTSSSAPFPTPLTQPTYSVFKLSRTPQKLEVKFPSARVSEGLLSTDMTRTESVELWLSVLLALVVFVGGGVVLTGSIWVGIGIAALLPLLLQLLVGRGDRPNHLATLRITDESEGRAFISLTTTSPPIRDRNGRVNGLPTQSTLHGSRLSIESVKISPVLRLVPGQSPLMAQLSFSLHNPPAHCNRLRIVGSYQEMRWLSHHFAQWGHNRNQVAAIQSTLQK
ncbi:MAG: hypothetical protein AAFQ63_14985 [Cyanobacteria bacterium J06621_11]